MMQDTVRRGYTLMRLFVDIKERNWRAEEVSQELKELS
jgi:hypothetical protein